MNLSDPYSLGVILVVAGLGCVLLYLALTRLAARLKPEATAPGRTPLEVDLAKHEDAVLVVQQGGRIVAINEKARQNFNLDAQEIPSLERLARRVRPSNQFMELCAAEGRAALTLEGRLFEGTSYTVPNGTTRLMLVSLRMLDLNPAFAADAAATPGQNLQTFNEITQSIARSLDLADTLEAVLAGVDRLIPADNMEVTVWDGENQNLVPYRLATKPSGERSLEAGFAQYQVNEGISGTIAVERKPVLIEDILAEKRFSLSASRRETPYRSFLGVPLETGDGFIGTLELAATSVGAFHQSDLELLKLFSGQAAISIRNALIYQAEQRRAAELSGLAQLSHAIGSVRDPSDLFQRLVQSIAPLIDVEILGFLIYNETRHTLEGQVPFQGLPAQAIEFYRSLISPGSQAEQILLNQDVLLTVNAAEDEQWSVLGLAHIATAGAMRESALIPLISGGRMLGYLQASNHRSGAQSFSQDELHLLTIIANQSAPIIENATLILQSRQRAQRAEALRRIGSLVSSAATLDEILQYSLTELVRLLRADAAAVFLLDEPRGELRLHAGSLYGLGTPEQWNLRVTIEDPQFPFTVTGSQHSLLSNDLPGDQRIIPLYKPIIAEVGLSSAVVVPLVVRDRGIGEVWLASRSWDAFDLNDLQVVATAAGQLAGVVEQVSLTAQTDESLRRRVEQLTAITRISRELSTSLDLKYLLQMVFDEALRTTGANCGTIMLFDPHAESSPPPVMFFIGDSPSATLLPVELGVLERGDAQLIRTYESSHYKPPHGGVHASMVVPIAYQEHIAGLIHLHADNPETFDETALEITQTLAVQAAIVLGNALQYQEQSRRSELLNRQVETFNRLLHISREVQLDQPLPQALEKIAIAIQETTPFQVVLVSLYDPISGMLERTCHAGIPEDVWEQLRSHVQPYASVRKLLKSKYLISRSYYIPHDQEPVVPEDIHSVVVLPLRGAQGANTWDPDDLLLTPLQTSDGTPLGLISVDAPRDGLQPDRTTIESLEIFAGQAALLIESYRRSHQLAGQVEALGKELARLEQANVSYRASLPILLRKDVQQAVSIHTLSRQIQRIRDGLEMAEVASRQESRPALLHTLAQELITRMGMDVALIAERQPGGVRLVEVLGTVSGSASPEALFGQRNPLRQSLQDGHLRAVADLEHTPEWRSTPLLAGLEGKSFLCLPIAVEGQVSVSIMAVGRKPVPAFNAEDEQILAQLARQVAISLQSLELLTETRRRLEEVNLLLQFSRRLGSLDAGSIFSTLVQTTLQAIPAANAGWAAVWDEKTGCLIPQAEIGFADPDSMLQIVYRRGEALPGKVFASGQPRRVDDLHFASDYNLSPENLLRYRRGTGGRLPLSSLLVPINSGETGLGLLVLDNYITSGAFTTEDEALAATLTQQAALALENARLFQASEERTGQLQALTNVATTITSSLSSEELTGAMLDQFLTVMPFDTATLWLREGDTLTVAAVRGFEDSEERLGLSVAVEDSMLFNEMISTGHAIHSPDVRQDMRFPILLEPDRLSWLGIPLIAKGEVTGAIALEKKEAQFFTPEHIQVATTFASQAAVALENARLYEESLRRAADLNERSQRLALLNRLSTDLSSSLDSEHILQATIREMMGALNGSGACAITFGAHNRAEIWAELPAPEGTLPHYLPDAPLFERLRQTQGIFSVAEVSQEPEVEPLLPYLESHSAHALLALPLAAGADLLGVLLLMKDRPYRFTTSEIELGRTISNQAAIAIQNARLFAETRRLTADLERRVEERTQELSREHRNSQTLLRIITELSASLDMTHVLRRTLLVLNEATGAELSVLIQNRDSGEQLTQIRTSSDPASTIPIPAFEFEKTISEWVCQQRRSVRVENLTKDPQWANAKNLPPVYKALIAVPLILGEESLGALLLFHGKEGKLSGQQLDLVEAAARQISITINNAELFGLIRDQAERLGGMLRDQQIEASRSRAILEAVADGVLVTDAGNAVTLFNASAQKILNLRADEVVGRSLEDFTGLFGKAAQAWVRTIRGWAQEGRSHQAGETYAEQINLDNGKVVAIHLAPVLWRERFLGTVTIFRDITHEVQVDRLKSEFVANVSHELRTPMTSIKGYVDILLMGAAGALNEQQAHFLETVKGNTQRLTRLVNDLLDISRIETERVTLNRVKMDITEIAQGVEADLRRRMREESKLMEVVFDIEPGLPPVYADPERVQQMLGNLVTNAYNYTPANGKIEVVIRALEDEIQVDVKDNGIGIAPEERERIFDRFYRGENPLVLATAGTGLGLNIVRTLVEMHQGRIWFESSGVPGEGSQFSFTLPRYDAEE